MCSCSSCYGYKPGKGGGWIFVVMLLLLLSLPFHGMLTVLLIAALWPWLLGRARALDRGAVRALRVA
jgi:hypothetical protein